jgi:hypothetical protein
MAKSILLLHSGVVRSGVTDDALALETRVNDLEDKNRAIEEEKR